MKLFDKIFKFNKSTEPADLTTVTRTEILEGFSIPGIIHNMQYHLTDLQVYSDGLISCWEMVDLPMFKDKLNKGWVVTSIPDGEAISIFNLGHWYIEHGEWQHNKETLYGYVYSLLKRLNPTLANLHNYNGNNSKMVQNILCQTPSHIIMKTLVHSSRIKSTERSFIFSLEMMTTKRI
jgi:hypothetical protein